MNDESQSCPKCGAAIPDGSPQGLCPKCLMAAAAAATNDTGQPPVERPPAPTREEIAAAFPHLEVLELIGQGGMGAVFKARQPKLDRLVALKILTRSRGADAGFADRFTREGRVLARLNHPGIVAVFDFGEADGFFYLLMEFVDGVNLRQAMQAGRFTPAEALSVVPRLCEALQFAHNEGILHRDIKPENILLDAKGRVKIVDFGIAKLVGEPANGGAITESGARLGTPHYMAPEQIEKPSEVDHRADIYSLGVVFYEMLTGELPIGRFAPPSEKSASDPRLDEVVFRTLEKEPSRRQKSAEEVKTQVETISGQPIPQSTPEARASRLRKLILLQLAGFAAAAALTALCWNFKTADTTETPLFGTLFILFGALFHSLGLPLWLRMMPMNSIYGARFRESFESEGRWYEINAYAGGRIMRWSLLIVAIGVVGFFLLPGKTYAWHAFWMLLAAVLAALVEAKIWAVRTISAKPSRRLGWSLGAVRCVMTAFIFAMSLRTFVAAPYRMQGDSLAPELPRGSRCIVWKLARPMVGDIVIYEHGGSSLTGRVIGAEGRQFLVNRNNVEHIPVPLEEVVGRIVLSTRSQVTEESPKPRAPRLLKAFTPADPTISKDVTLEPDKTWLVNSTETRVVRLFEVANPGVENCVVIYRAKIKTEGLQGRAYLEMLCGFTEFGEAFSRGLDKVISGTNDWASYQIPFFLKKGEKPDIIKLNLTVEGVGRVWIKDVELSAVSSVSPQASAPAPIRSELVTRQFNFHHIAADEAEKETKSILLSQPGRIAKPSDDNRTLTVTTTEDEMRRIATELYVADWPEPFWRGNPGHAAKGSPLVRAREFFDACARQDSGEIADLLALSILATLHGKKLSDDYLFFTKRDGDAGLIQELRGAWPGKDDAMLALAREWTLHPLTRLRALPGMAIGFGRREFVEATFESVEAPVSLGFLFEPSNDAAVDGDKAPQPFLETLPPWHKGPI